MQLEVALTIYVAVWLKFGPNSDLHLMRLKCQGIQKHRDIVMLKITLTLGTAPIIFPKVQNILPSLSIDKYIIG